MNKSARKKEIEENDINVPMGGFQQPPSSLSLENNAKLLMGKTGSLQRNVIETASSLSSACAKKSNARFESEVQYLSDQSHTLESKHRAIVRSESAPLLSATILHSVPSPFIGITFNTEGSSFSKRSSPSQPIVASNATTAIQREEISEMAMRKLELCFRKAETYEGIAMVLNVSLDRLLSQVTEIDNQRRRDGESREAQERKIQASLLSYFLIFHHLKRSTNFGNVGNVNV